MSEGPVIGITRGELASRRLESLSERIGPHSSMVLEDYDPLFDPVPEGVDAVLYPVDAIPPMIERETSIAVMVPRSTSGWVSVPVHPGELPPGSKVSVCGEVMGRYIGSLYPDLDVVSVHVSADDCLDDDADAWIVPEADLILLSPERKHSVLDPDTFLPVPGQGCLCFLCRKDDAEARRTLSGLNHMPTRIEVEAELGILKLTGHGRSSPLAAGAVLEDMFVHIRCTSFICDERRDADEYLQCDYVMDELLGISEYLTGKRDRVI